VGSAQSRWVLKFGPIVPRKLGANGSLLTRRWREQDSNLRSLSGKNRSNGEPGLFYERPTVRIPLPPRPGLSSGVFRSCRPA